MALWFHITGHTYGSWLPGDDRSFRTRHHREHIHGDYKNPPPTGKYDAKRLRALSLMREAGREPVRLSPEAQRLALDTMAEALQFLGAEVRIACLDDHHFHLLVRLPPRDSHPWASASKPTHVNAWAASHRGDYLPELRLLIGHAKRRAARELSEKGLVSPGGVWAARVHMRRIVEESHMEEAIAYIKEHAADDRSAALWPA